MMEGETCQEEILLRHVDLVFAGYLKFLEGMR